MVRTHGKIRIRKLSIYTILAFMLFFVLSSILLRSALYSDFSKEFSVQAFTFVIFAGVWMLLPKSMKRGSKKKNVVVTLWLIIVALVIIIRQDSKWIGNELLLIALFFVFYASGALYDVFVCAAGAAMLPYLFRWVVFAVTVGTYQGNRGPIHFTTVTMLLVALMFAKGVKWKWQYLTLGIVAILDFVGQSRTYLVTCAMAMAILTYCNFRGKFTRKKLVTIGIFMVIGLIGMIKLQDAFVELFTNKWSGQESIITGRSMMWVALLKQVSWIGFEENYILNTFGLSNVHNAILQAYCSNGIIVCALYIALLVSAAYKCVKHRKSKEMQQLMIVFLPVTVAGFFESNYFLDPDYLFLGICNAFLVGQIFRVARKNRGEGVVQSHATA